MYVYSKVCFALKYSLEQSNLLFIGAQKINHIIRNNTKSQKISSLVDKQISQLIKFRTLQKVFKNTNLNLE